MIRQLALPFDHAPQFDRAAFLQAPSNAEALAWLARPEDWPLGRMALWGGAGSGKSHLLHRWSKRVGAARLEGATLRLEPPAGPVVIDDADLAGERTLLHMLNAAHEDGHAVLLAGRAAPARWAVGLPDLSSRLRATLAVEIRPADDELLRLLLTALFADRQMAVPQAVQDWLLLRLPRTPAALREAAWRLDRMSLASGGRVTRAVAADMLAEFETEHGRLDIDGVGLDEDLPHALAAASPPGPGFL